MSDTPRLNEVLANNCDRGDDALGNVIELARTLERELAARDSYAVAATELLRRWVEENRNKPREGSGQ